MESLLDFFYSFPLLKIHIASVFTTLALVLFADHYGLTWVRGKKKLLSAHRVRKLHALTWIGLICIVFSGALMAQPAWSFYLGLLAFRLKLFFVAALILNALVIGKILHTATERTFSELTKYEKRPLIISGVVSFVCWSGAFIAAQFIG